MSPRSPTVVRFSDGIAINGEFPSGDVMEEVGTSAGPKFPLCICDPPYGNIVKEVWDKIVVDDSVFARWMIDWTKAVATVSAPGSDLSVFGGIGNRAEKNMPPFVHSTDTLPT